MKLSKRTKKIGAMTACLAVGTTISMLKDKDNSIKIRNRVISTQDFYICDLEQFIMDHFGAENFPEMVGIPE